ncbi:hypothetical protein ACFL6O_04295 [candidate division KSB1 bacterium]
MSFKNLLTINAVIAIFMGSACMLLPAKLLSNYGVVLPQMGMVIYQFWGATLFGLGLVTWLLRVSNEIKVQRSFALALCLTYCLSCIFAVKGQYSGANYFGWSTVALYLVLAIAFGYYRFYVFRKS